LILCLRRPRAVQSHFHQSLRLCQLLCRQLTPTRSQPRGTTGERNHRTWVPSLEVLSVAWRLWLRLAQPGCSSVNARQHTAMRIIQITPRFILAALPRPNMRTKYRLHNRGSTTRQIRRPTPATLTTFRVCLTLPYPKMAVTTVSRNCR